MRSAPLSLTMRRRCFCLLLLALLLLSVPALAHPGRTDGKGGHYDRSTGEYHYHHGYPAHQHTNGVCPYDFKDKTGESSGTSGSSSTSGKAAKQKTAPRDNSVALSVLLGAGGGIAVRGAGALWADRRHGSSSSSGRTGRPL